MKFIRILRERRLFQFIGGYTAAGWLVLEAVGEFTGRGLIPEIIYPLVLTFFLFGFPATIVVAWFHGARGAQEMPSVERWLLSGIASVALITAGFAARQHILDQAPSDPFATLSPIEDIRRVAVTYLDGRGGEDAELLAEGLTGSLIDELSRVQMLHVVSQNGVEQFRGSDVSPDSIGRALQVGTIVDGRVTQADSIVRVDVRLLSAADGSQFDHIRFDRPRSEVFALENDLTREVGAFLRRRLGEEVELVEREIRTENAEAWLLVQRAQKLKEEGDRLGELEDHQGAEATYLEADSLLAEAQAMAPQWADPVTRRGWLTWWRSRLRGPDRSAANAELLQTGMTYARRALALAPEDPDALELRATLQYWRFLLNLTSEPGESERLLAQAERDFQAAIAKNPKQASALALYSHLLLRKGQLAQAKVFAERSYNADPFFRIAHEIVWRVFTTSMDLGDRPEARKWCAEGQRRFPDFYRFKECQVWLYVLPDQQPEIDRAWKLCDEWVELTPPEVRTFHRKRCEMFVGMALVRADLPDSARAVVRRARADRSVDPVRELSYLGAIARTWLGDHDEAFELLAEYAAVNPEEFTHGDERNWWLADLQDDPRWDALHTGQHH